MTVTAEGILSHIEVLAAKLACKMDHLLWNPAGTGKSKKEHQLSEIGRRLRSGEGPFGKAGATEEFLAKVLLVELAFYKEDAANPDEIIKLWLAAKSVRPGTYRDCCDEHEVWWPMPYSTEPLRRGNVVLDDEECPVYGGFHGQVYCYVVMPHKKWRPADILVIHNAAVRNAKKAALVALDDDWAHQHHPAVQAMHRVLGHRMVGLDADHYIRDYAPYVVFPFGCGLNDAYSDEDYSSTLGNAEAPETFDNDDFHIEVTPNGKVRLYYNFNTSRDEDEIGREVEAHLRELFPNG